MTKLSKRKPLRFAGFHPNVGKTFTAFISCVLKVIKAFIPGLSKVRENCKAFLSRSFSRLKGWGHANFDAVFFVPMDSLGDA